jgi:hypothetical protein
MQLPASSPSVSGQSQDDPRASNYFSHPLEAPQRPASLVKPLWPDNKRGTCVCRRVGNTGKMGALFGILYAIRAPVPKPGSITFMLGQLFLKVKGIIAGEPLAALQTSCYLS